MPKLPLLPTLMTAAFLLLTLSAGVWQLNRAEEKRLIFAQLEQHSALEMGDRDAFESMDAYAPVRLEGAFDTRLQLLLENQIMEGRAGVHVLTPFYAEDIGAWLFVNRGWMAADALPPDEQLPDYVQGLKAPLPKTAVQLGDIALKPVPLQRITYFDEKVIFPHFTAHICHRSGDKACIILPFVIKMDGAMPGGFVRQWGQGLMPPAKHMGYAVQWFGMAMALTVLFIVYIRKTNAREKQE